MKLRLLGPCAWFAVLVTLAPAAEAQTSPTLVAPNDANLRYEGHWDVKPATATTVNSGSRLFIRFTGSRLAATFDTAGVTNPAQIYVTVDGGPAQLYRLGPKVVDLAPSGLGDGPHDAMIAVKDVDERANRWVPPLRSGLVLTGLQLDAGAQALPLPAPTGPRIEFLGDSITQGVRAIGPQLGPNGSDATAGYAWLVGTAFGAQLAQVGFGAQGIVANGGGGVPNAGNAFQLNFQGSPADPGFVPQAVVINQGTNDSAASATTFQAAYLAYLRRIRATWADAWIFAMRPFNGAHAGDIAAAVAGAGDDRIVYVDTTGWLTRPSDYTDTLHPTAAAHALAAQRLIEIITAHTGWAATDRAVPTPRLLAGFEDGDAGAWRAGDLVDSVAVTQAAPPGGAAPLDGTSSLAATSSAAPFSEWRTVTYRPANPLTVPARVTDLFAYVALARPTTSLFDVRISVTGPGRREKSETSHGLTNQGGPQWNRVSIDLRDWAGPIETLSISVRGEGSTTASPLSFQLDDLGFTEAPPKPTETASSEPIGGTVPATLALTLGTSASFGPFTPGAAKDYVTTLAAGVTSTAADAQLTIRDPASDRPGRLVNGEFALAQPLEVRASSPTAGTGPFGAVAASARALLFYDTPVSNDPVSIDLRQSVLATEPLRTGAYGKTLTLTLSTTTP